MLESELKQENEVKNEWLYHFGFLQFQTWTQWRETEFSRASEPSKSWHRSLFQPLINCAYLFWWKKQIWLPEHRDQQNQMGEPQLWIWNLTVEREMHLGLPLFPALHQVCVQGIHFHTILGTHSHFIFPDIFRETYLAVSCMNTHVYFSSFYFDFT